MLAAVERATAVNLPVLPRFAEETARFKEALESAKSELNADRVTALAVAADHLAKACSQANDHQRAYVLDRVSTVLFKAIP